MKKPDYYICDLLNECIDRFSETFSHTLDTLDYVPQAAFDNVLKQISKYYARRLKRLKGIDKAHRRELTDKKRIFQLFGKRKPINSVEVIPVENLPAQTTPAEVVEDA